MPIFSLSVVLAADTTPVVEETLTLNQKISEGLITFILGMGTTFIVLIVLWGILAVLGRIFSNLSARKAPQAVDIPDAANPISFQTPVQTVDDGALIAVISAAVAVEFGDTGTPSGFAIRSIRRATKWNGSK